MEHAKGVKFKLKLIEKKNSHERVPSVCYKIQWGALVLMIFFCVLNAIRMKYCNLSLSISYLWL